MINSLCGIRYAVWQKRTHLLNGGGWFAGADTLESSYGTIFDNDETEKVRGRYSARLDALVEAGRKKMQVEALKSIGGVS